MDTKQPEALRLADWCDEHSSGIYRPSSQAASELRRLHAENDAMRSKLQTLEELGAAGDDVQILRMGYAAARLEIASLHARLQELGQMARDVNSRRVRELETLLKAARLEIESLKRYDQQALEPCEACGWKALVPGDCCVNCRRNELEAQLSAIGAGGMEPLRKRCLHQISEPQAQPVAPDFDVRTSAGGRGYVAWFFSSVMHRYDFHDYINNVLAADFACALAKWLSTAPQPAAQALGAETNLGDLDALAKQFADSYASPHHFTMSVAGLRKVVAAIAAQQGGANG